MKLNKSITIWTLAFLSADLLFWLLILYSCIQDGVSCFETVMFGEYFFYLPFTLIPVAIPPTLWIVAHGLIGALVGWLLRRHPVRWWLAGIIACVVLFGTSYGFGYWQGQEELKRETTTQLWLVDQASSSQIQFHTAQRLADGTLKVDDGYITYNLAAFDTSHTKVDLGTAMLSYKDFLAANTGPILFEVTSNPKAIISMRQIAQP